VGIKTGGEMAAQDAISAEPIADQLRDGSQFDLAVIQRHHQLTGWRGKYLAEASLPGLGHLLQIGSARGEAPCARARNQKAGVQPAGYRIDRADQSVAK
jgi:hypothetical protein